MDSLTFIQDIIDDYDMNMSYVVNEPCEKQSLFKFGSLFTVILNSIIFFFSLIGNSLVLWIVVKYENLSSITNIFIVNLSISDLVFSALLPFWAAYHWFGWIFGDVLCKAMSAVFSVGFYSGLIFLTMMTIYRYMAVVYPLSALKTRKPGYGMLVSMISWLLSLFAAIPVMIFTKVKTELDNIPRCEYDDATWEKVSTYQQNLIFLISFAIITSCYVSILRTLLRTPSHRKQKTVKLILIIVVVFFLSWAPYNILIFLQSIEQLNEDCEASEQLQFALYICEKVAFSHCCLNPVLYAFVGIKFRRHLRRMFHQYWPCSYQEHRHSIRFSSHDNLHHEDASLY